MADLDIPIAGRMYRVACEDGQEENLARAGRFLSDEAELLREQFGDRFGALPESRVLLMASLMLGDRFRAKLDAEAAGGAFAPEAAPQVPPPQDPALGARVAELEAELAAAREAEAAALAALEDAAAAAISPAIRRTRAAADEDEEASEDEDAPQDEEA